MSAMKRASRTLLALVVASGLAMVTVAQVAACSCAMQELPDAIRTADVAIVGTLAGTTPEPVAEDLAGPGDQMQRWVWQVERSRDTLETDQIEMVGWADNGANCGVTFGAGERWLVLAYAEGSQLSTNGCMMNQRLDGTDPELEATLAESLPIEPTGDDDAAAGFTVPMPILLGGAAVIAIALAGVIAFRRDRVS